jgi:hypothetical protein
VPRDFHNRGTLVLSCALALIGVAIVARTIDEGGGVLSVGVLMGVLFVLAGLGRLWVTWKRV